MALFKIFKGSSKNLGQSGGTERAREGYAYFTPDDGKFYIDIADSDNVIIGTSSTSGANRICINSDFFILDCGTANINGKTETTYVYCGDSSSVITENTMFLECGNSQSEINANTVVYNCGSSFLQI